MATRIVIIGGGFAGVRCARSLRKRLSLDACEILLFDRENSMVFYPLLAEVAGATIGPDSVAAVNRGLVPRMAEHAFPLKSVGDAIALRFHVMEQLEKAEVCDDPERRRWYLSFVVVGGGFSGVEVAGELNDLVRASLRFYGNFISR